MQSVESSSDIINMLRIYTVYVNNITINLTTSYQHVSYYLLLSRQWYTRLIKYHIIFTKHLDHSARRICFTVANLRIDDAEFLLFYSNCLRHYVLTVKIVFYKIKCLNRLFKRHIFCR